MVSSDLVILVDVQNVYYTTRQQFSCNFDYNKFWAAVTAGRRVKKAIAYTTDRGDQKQREFQNILRAIGFEVKLKPFIQRSDGTAKGDWDVGITIDALEYTQAGDTLALVSGDGDFDLLVHKLRQDREAHVEVYGVESLTANALILASSKFVPIDSQFLLKSSR